MYAYYSLEEERENLLSPSYCVHSPYRRMAVTRKTLLIMRRRR